MGEYQNIVHRYFRFTNSNLFLINTPEEALYPHDYEVIKNLSSFAEKITNNPDVKFKSLEGIIETSLKGKEYDEGKISA